MNRFTFIVYSILLALLPFTSARAVGEKTVILEPMQHAERYVGSENAEPPAASSTKSDGRDVVSSVAPESMVPRLQRDADAFLKALTEKNEAKVAQLLADEIKKEASAKDLLAGWEVGWASLEKQDFVIRSHAIEMPQTPQRTNGLYVSFIPVTLDAVHAPGDFTKTRVFGPTSITMTYYFVAVSKDNGKSWKFFPAGEDRSLTDFVLGAAAENLVMPVRFINAVSN